MGGKSKKVTVGYRYYMGLHFGVCHGPIDALTEIRVGDRIAWTGEQTFSGSILVNSPSLFGGDKREGGVQGYADVLGGEETQGQNQYLADKIGGEDSSTLVPNFRGIFSLVFRGGEGAGREDGGGLVTSNNPYVKPWAFKVRRILEGWGGSITTEETQYSNEVLFPWASVEATGEPRACLNDHEYRYDPVGAGPVSEWGDFETALALAEADLGYSLGYYMGWSSTLGETTIQFPFATNPGEAEILELHFNHVEPTQGYFEVLQGSGPTLGSRFADTGIIANSEPIYWTGEYAIGGAGFDAGIWILTPTNVDPFPGITEILGSAGASYPSGAFMWRIESGVIQARRKIRAPDEPCFPRCEEPFPNYQFDSTYCVIGDVAVKKNPYVLTAGNFKVLSLYATGGAPSEVTVYPLNPTLPEGHPNYNDEAYWTAARNAAILAGYSVPSTYSEAGNGGPTTFPRLVTEAYVRDAGSITFGDPWEAGIAQIGDCMNPAHIIYQCLTDPDWGMGYPEAQIDEANFLEAAQALFDEGFGLCLIWNQQSTIEEFVQLVLDHIGAVYYADPRTGFFKLKLIRDDYEESDLPLYDETNILSLDSFQRGGYGETVNEVSVVYTDATTDKEAAITVQDLANIQAQGAVVSQTKQYPGITDGDLAARVAQRDLLAGSTPLAKIVITVNRDAWDTVPGDVVKVSWDKLGLSSVICRVLKVNTGTLTDGAITLELAEDVFGLPDSSYSQQEDNGWVEPDNTPDDVSPADAFEIPYWDLVRDLSAGDLAALDADTAYIGTLGVQGAPVELEYRIWSRIDTGDFEDAGTGPFSPGAFAVGAITQSQTVIPYTGAVNLDLVDLNSRAQIGTGRSAEYVLVTAKDTDAGEITVSRAILDTTPQSHAANAPIFFIEETNAGFDPTERATGETTELRLTAISSSGESDLDDATTLEVTPDQRQYRPYPPGNVTVNGEAFPAEIVSADNPSESLVVTWAHRDRIQQTATYIEQDEGNIGPEAGTTYTIRIYDTSDESLQYSATGLTDTAHSIELSGVFNARLELTSVRDGVESWQPQTRTFDYIGSALLLTEDEDRIITEDGDYITPEE